MDRFCQVGVIAETLFYWGFKQNSNSMRWIVGQGIDSTQDIEYTWQKCCLCKVPMCSISER